jgi:hypothetical protein
MRFFTVLILSAGLLTAIAWAGEPLRLLFDDYYQKPRDDVQFGQGVARGDAELRGLSNFYHPDATAIPNGTFVLKHLMADTFSTEVSRDPLSAELLDGVDVYLLACPVRESHGGRADLGEKEADVLERFVAAGGRLVMVANSIPDPEKSGFDWAGMNTVARRFGLRFAAVQTETILIPIPADDPHFDGPGAMIFGNGTTVEILPEAEGRAEVWLENTREQAPGPVAVMTRHGQGKVLLFGDAGTLGNAHAFRGDVGHVRAVREMMLGLLDDGPVPRYGWEEGQRFQVRVEQEQIISGYPEFLEVFKLPQAEGTEVFTSGMRLIDLQSAGANAVGSKDFVSAVSRQEATFAMEVGATEGSGHDLTWRDEAGGFGSTVLGSGRQVRSTAPRGDTLVAWHGSLLHELLLAPLRAHAQAGDRWQARHPVRLPNLQLGPTARWEEAMVDTEFVGEAEQAGRPCYVFAQIVLLEDQDWTVADLVEDAYAVRFDPTMLAVQAGGQLVVARYWIDRDSLLPVRSELRVSAAVWWNDNRFPASYIGSHDSKNYENWETTNFVVSYGRTLTAEFTPLGDASAQP